jgi:Ca2+-binding RTX toxin-like protein
VSYSQSTSAVVIRQDGTASSGGFAQGDILLNIETVTGSNYNDVFYGSTGDDTLQGLGGNDTFAGGLGADTMDGGSGSDRVSYSQSTSAVVVRQDGTASSGGFAQGDILVNIETVTGSAYNDVFYGSTGSDTLQGLAGNDTFAGGLGADTMDGGSGIDRVSYSQSTAAVSVRLDGVASTGGFAEGDILLGVENVTGSGYNDIVYGGAADNVLEGLQGFDILNGQDGNDTLVGGLGGDTLDGGNGIDTASYAGSISGVTVRQDGTASSGGEAQGDVLISVENVIGSAYNDVFYGSTADNVLSGGGGDDTFAGGLGADTMDGGSGIDRVSYSQSTAGITVLLDGGAGSGGFAQGDILVNIETVTGSGYNDTIYGNAADNLLQGLGGNDVLAGGAGNDTLQGGNGADRFVFASGGGSDVISDFAVSGGDMVELDSSLFTDFADVMTHTTDTAGGAVISKGGVTITLTGVTKAQLSAGHFDFVASAPVEPQAKAFGPLTLPGVLNDDPLVLPGEAEAKPMGPLTLIPLDDGPPPSLDPQDPLVLPVGLDAKAIVDDIPIICPTGTGGGFSLPDDTGLAIADKAGQRDDHWILQQPRWIDWVA